MRYRVYQIIVNDIRTHRGHLFFHQQVSVHHPRGCIDHRFEAIGLVQLLSNVDEAHGEISNLVP